MTPRTAHVNRWVETNTRPPQSLRGAAAGAFGTRERGRQGATHLSSSAARFSRGQNSPDPPKPPAITKHPLSRANDPGRPSFLAALWQAITPGVHCPPLGEIFFRILLPPSLAPDCSANFQGFYCWKRIFIYLVRGDESYKINNRFLYRQCRCKTCFKNLY